MELEIKCCPYCGEKESHMRLCREKGLEIMTTAFTEEDRAYVKCFTCGAMGGEDITDRLAVKKWNKRVPEPPVKDLKRCLARLIKYSDNGNFNEDKLKAKIQAKSILKKLKLKEM